MTTMRIEDCRPGQRVRVVEEVDRRAGNWHAEVVGVIQSVRREKTGSWYAHGKDHKYWLWRIRLLKDDGEETTLTVTPLTRIERLEDAPAPA